MATELGVSKEHITKTPGVCGGRACVAGSRVRVMDVVGLHERSGLSPDEIVDQFPSITLADVYAALAYYFDHKDEIDGDFRDAREIADRLRAQFPTLREKRGG
jgi:uncharacterized protein (DUF433 family)